MGTFRRSRLRCSVALEDLTVPRREQPAMPRLEQRLPVLEALRRHFLIALLPVILLVAAAIAYGLEREPEYESEARLNVGGLNLTSQSIEGYTAAVTQLAVAYSRSIHATRVVEDASRATGIAPGEIVSRTDATPIQGSSVIRILVTGGEAGQTRALADAMADSLVDYAIELNRGRSASQRLLDRYERASRQFIAERQRLDRARRPRARRQIEQRLSVAKLERDTAGFLYGQSKAGEAVTELVQKLAPASPPTSDRDEKTRDYAAGAAIAGVLIGIGLAVARANALARRRLGAY
jgi:hypothetical protein